MVQLIGERHNVVCISQMEKHYFEAYREKLPGLWFYEHEGLERVPNILQPQIPNTSSIQVRYLLTTF